MLRAAQCLAKNPWNAFFAAFLSVYVQFSGLFKVGLFLADFAKTVQYFPGCHLVQVTKMVLRAVLLVLLDDFGPGLFLVHLKSAFQRSVFLCAEDLKKL